MYTCNTRELDEVWQKAPCLPHNLVPRHLRMKDTGDSSSAGVIANPWRILSGHYSSSSDSSTATAFEQLIPRHSLHDAPHFKPARLHEHFPPHLALHWHRIIFMRLSGAGARSVIIGVNLLPSRLRRCRGTRVVRGSLKFFCHTPSNSRVLHAYTGITRQPW